MTSGHLVTDTDLTLLGNVDLSHLDDARRQLVTDSDSEFLTLQLCIELFIFLDEVHHQCTYQSVGVLVFCPVAQLNGSKVHVAEIGSGELGALADHFGSHVVLHALRRVAFGELQELVHQYLLQVCHLAVELVVNLRQQRFVRQFGTTGLDDAGEQTLADNHTLQRRRSLQGSILHIACLVTEDSTKQLLFRRRIGLSLRSDLTNQDVTRLDTCTHADNTVLVEVFGGFFAYVRNVGSQLFHTTLRLTNFQRVLFDVYGSQKVFAHHAFVQHDGILIVVSLPRHVCHQQVLTQSKLALLG